jgi:phospholipase/carboxylesterase
VRDHLERAAAFSGEALQALIAAPEAPQPIVAAYRSLRFYPRACEALYPLSPFLRPVGNFFLEQAARSDEALQARLAAADPTREGVGFMHVAGPSGTRGAFSLYVPEYYDPSRSWPLVMALHGGSGNGRGFLWSWLRDARSRGAILVAPTATGQTWALMGDDTDTPNLNRIVDQVRARWNIDERRMLLTGMSDGGTFSYVTGLDGASRFTHLAPVAATFHPLMAEMADAERLRGLPIFITHGRQDWMFPVQTARQTQSLLSAAGAKVVYREIDDLSHTYPRDENARILDWFLSSSS